MYLCSASEVIAGCFINFYCRFFLCGIMIFSCDFSITQNHLVIALRILYAVFYIAKMSFLSCSIFKKIIVLSKLSVLSLISKTSSFSVGSLSGGG